MKAEASAEWRFAPAYVFAHVRARLTLTCDGGGVQEARPHGPARLRAAAVLVGLAVYPEQLRVILTQTTMARRFHSGQIAFPGGKIEAWDKSPAVALREANEEIGLDGRQVEPLGYLDPYPTGIGFCIVPVVAKVAAPVAFKINPDEVDEAFEVPFAFLMNAANHALRHEMLEGKMRQFHAMPYGRRNIWGVTAGILRNLYERLYS